jgi:flagellar protein FliJ
MGFSFRLETVLNWKKSLEEISQMKLSGMLRELNEQEAAIRRLAEDRRAADRRLTGNCGSGLAASEYVGYKEFAEGNLIELIAKQNEKALILQRIERERESLISLMKARKILEKLKEKKWMQFNDQMKRSDQKAMDERSVIQARRPSYFLDKL